MDLVAEAAHRPIVLDGGLATELERRGHDLSSALWSARLLRDDPAAIVAVHEAFVAAGAEVVTSASYQASFDALGDATPALLRLSVTLARDSGARWVAASVGPYGAMLADGSEYRGDYGLSVDELRAWHRPRLAVLADAGADVLAAETIPCLAEVDALCAELAELDVPAWLSITCDGTSTPMGEQVAAAFAMAAECPAVFALGVNCTAPSDVGALVGVAGSYGKPVVVYPNSGERWDAEHRVWSGRPGLDAADVQVWLADGARLVGGCCRVGPDDIAAISAATSAGEPVEAKQVAD